MYVCMYVFMHVCISPNNAALLWGVILRPACFSALPRLFFVSVGGAKDHLRHMTFRGFHCCAICGGPIPLARMSLRELFKAHLGGPPITQSSLRGGDIHLCLYPYIHI